MPPRERKQRPPKFINVVPWQGLLWYSKHGNKMLLSNREADLIVNSFVRFLRSRDVATVDAALAKLFDVATEHVDQCRKMTTVQFWSAVSQEVSWARSLEPELVCKFVPLQKFSSAVHACYKPKKTDQWSIVNAYCWAEYSDQEGSGPEEKDAENWLERFRTVQRSGAEEDMLGEELTGMGLEHDDGEYDEEEEYYEEGWYQYYEDGEEEDRKEDVAESEGQNGGADDPEGDITMEDIE